MRKILFILSVALGVTISWASPLEQQPEEGEKIEIEKPIDPEGTPRSPNSNLTAYYYSSTGTVIVTCQGYGCATVSIMSPTLQTLDSDFIDPDITPVTCLSTPSTPGQYYLFIVTSSFTANGTFVVE